MGTVANNALAHGAGALNIDACRIGSFLNTTPSGVDRRNAALAEMGYRPNPYQMGVRVPECPPGRWPANLILSHLPECKQVGRKVVKSNGHFPASRGPGGLSTSGHVGQNDLVESRSSTETIPDWQCIEGCPVKIMDEQSGERPGFSGGGAQDNRKSGTEVIPSFNRKPSAQFLKNDTGGASRFFQQVQDEF